MTTGKTIALTRWTFEGRTGLQSPSFQGPSILGSDGTHGAQEKIGQVPEVSKQDLMGRLIAGVQPPQDPGEPEGKTASADDLERDKERIL